MGTSDKEIFYLKHKSYLAKSEALRNGKILIEKYNDITIDGVEVDATIRALMDFSVWSN